jgi:RNase P subunit RPR2
MEKVTKLDVKEEIKKAFNKELSPKEIKKIKRLAMKYNIKLGELRKKFCKKCFSTKLKIRRVKKGIKTVECEQCKNVMRWKLKN